MDVFVLFILLASPVGIVGVSSSVSGTAPSDITIEVINAMQSAGIGWVRIWINWYQIEHDSGYYDWSNLDSIVNAYVNRGFNIFATLQGGNPFYDTLSSYPPELYPAPQYGTPPIRRPEALNAWLRFIDSTITRYKDRIKYWSIWNEPNLQQFWPPDSNPDPHEYFQLVKATVPVIRNIDPNAKIITGNVSMIDYEYLNAIIDSLIPYTDYIGFHPYRLYAEDDQDNFPVAGLIVSPTPMTSFDEEMDSLLTLLKNADPTGRVKLWDEESGFPSHPDPVLWDTLIHSCDTSQAKNILRKYILDFAYFVEVSTYWGDYDLNSIIHNALGENWVNDFYDMTLQDWQNKEAQFLFNYISLTYTPQRDTVWIEAKDYDTLAGNVYLSYDSSYIYCSDTSGFPENYVKYTVNVPYEGNYTLWLYLRNQDTILPVWIATFNYTDFYVITTANPYEQTKFIWTLPFDAEYLKLNIYWQKGPHFFYLRSDTSYTLTLIPYLPGSELARIGLKRESPPSVKKLSYYAVKNFTKVWDGRWIRDTFVLFSADSGSVPPFDWQKKRIFVFKDTVIGSYGVAYWLGVPPENDFYPEYQFSLTFYLSDTTVLNSPVIINFFDGSQTPVNYTVTDTEVIFQNLPISDIPKFLAFNINSVSVKEKIKKYKNERISLKIYPWLIRSFRKIKIYSDKNYSPVNIKLYDLSGRRIIEKGPLFLFSGENEFFIKDISSGLYFVLVDINSIKIKKKILVIK